MTLIRIWVTTLIREDNSQKIYSLIALLTCLEALLGVISCCIPVIRPVLTKFGESKLWSSLISSFSRNRFSLFSHPSSGNRSGTHSRKRRNGGRNANEMRNCPSPKQNLAPRFVDSKAANMMFSHHSQQSSGGVPPRPTPKSPFYRPEPPWDEKKGAGITVQRDWDVERGDSQGTDRRPLTDEYGRGW